MTVTKVSVPDQQGSESAYSDPKTKPNFSKKFTQVCVEPRPSALNKTLPAFAAKRGCMQHISIDICCRRPLSSKQLHAAAAVDRRDRQTNGRTSDRYIDPAPRTMRTASIRAPVWNFWYDFQPSRVTMSGDALLPVLVLTYLVGLRYSYNSSTVPRGPKVAINY